MREIKFRAWDGEQMIYPPEGYMFDATVIATSNNKGIGVSQFPRRKIELMQFTGLKDRNGKEIYEGDIGEIKTQGGRIERFVVEWGIHRREMKSGWTVDIPGFCFRIDGFPSFPIANNYLNGHDLDIITIIGNIFESPELLSTTTKTEGQ